MYSAVGEAIDELTVLIPDFPKPGIVFRDLSPVFADGAAFTQVTDALLEPFAGRVDAVAGVEARGFILAAAAAYALGTGMLLIRKSGKLPRAVLGEDYALEYGSARLEVHDGELPAGSRVLIVDDVLATGGTLRAAKSLVQRGGWSIVGIAVVLELEALGGRAGLGDVHALSVV